MGIKGKKDIGALQNEADRVQASLLKDLYEHKTIVVAPAASDVSLKTLVPTAFGTIDRAHTLIIRTDADISFKFNSTSNDPIPLTAAEGSFISNTLEVENIYFSSALGANVKVFLV